jgi:type IV pilus assembly protein PilB
VLEVNDEVRDLIAGRATEQAIRKAAKRCGMRSMFEDGLEKSAQGLTTLDEVLRVVSPDESSEPAARTRASEVASGSSPVPVAPVTGPEGEPARVPGGRRVLVVEDSPTITSVVKYFLELEGFDVLLAGDGLVGLEMAQREHPDLIVSDVNMPEMGGVAMVKALRLDPRMSDVCILMLTSESSVECETEVLAAGADDYILKPVEPRRLAARVKALLGRPRPTAA